jgi:uncharacterized membrane protein YciS (DUF1049 family)
MLSLLASLSLCFAAESSKTFATSRTMMQRIRWILLILGITLFVVLSVWNSGTVTVQFPFMADRELSLSNLLLITSAGSFVFGSVMTGWMLRGVRKAKAAKEKAANEKARLEEAKAEVAKAEAAKAEANKSDDPFPSAVSE